MTLYLLASIFWIKRSASRQAGCETAGAALRVRWRVGGGIFYPASLRRVSLLLQEALALGG